MKKLSLFILIIIIFSCKKDSIDPEAAIQKIVGKWRHESYLEIVNGKKVWKKDNSASRIYLIFKTDGSPISILGTPLCCGPTFYNLNGNFITLKSGNSFSCPNVKCSGCLIWTIIQSENELILSYCDRNSVSKYIRE
ncbi:hypothetical protein [Dyadobacter sp. NIV53]|uniref:hypothetical protein n=1 Tax=Dyadobacter sp. NIV53 TaxID=2861765 RepID=UPI001C86E85A|nr:hypothetical protein [Dyadobacter sp. NIV53]